MNGMPITTTPRNDFGRWLLERFAERGWDSYRQAAEYIGISHTQLRSYVLGVIPRPPSLERIATKFGVTRPFLDNLLATAVLDALAARDLIRLTVIETLEQQGWRAIASSAPAPHVIPADPDDPEAVAIADELRRLRAQLPPDRRATFGERVRADIRRLHQELRATS